MLFDSNLLHPPAKHPKLFLKIKHKSNYDLFLMTLNTLVAASNRGLCLIFTLYNTHYNTLNFK